MSNNADVISFTRKADDNPNVTIIKKFGKPTKYLDQYIQGTEMWKEINKFNLFYVLQTKLSIEDSVFKVGVSAGERRLKDYLSHNGKTNRIKKGGWVMWNLSHLKNLLDKEGVQQTSTKTMCELNP